MIQRIQSLFLLVAAIISVGLFFVPLSQIPEVDPEQGDVILTLSISGITSSGGTQVIVWPLLIYNVIVGLMCLACIFLYRNRTFQIKMTMFTFLLSCILLVGIFWYADRISRLPAESEYQVGIYLIFVQLFVLLRAIKFIRKDEEMVKSADRIR